MRKARTNLKLVFYEIQRHLLFATPNELQYVDAYFLRSAPQSQQRSFMTILCSHSVALSISNTGALKNQTKFRATYFNSTYWPLVPYFCFWATLGNLNSCVEIISWVPCVTQIQSIGLPRIFLRAQP